MTDPFQDTRYDYFDLLPEHVALLKASNVSNRLSSGEYGAAEIDCKRPYGNSIGIEEGMARIVGIPLVDDEYLTHEGRLRVEQLHAQTPIALQVVLTAQSFKPGLYRCKRYDNKWEWVES